MSETFLDCIRASVSEALGLARRRSRRRRDDPCRHAAAGLCRWVGILHLCSASGSMRGRIVSRTAFLLAAHQSDRPLVLRSATGSRSLWSVRSRAVLRALGVGAALRAQEGHGLAQGFRRCRGIPVGLESRSRSVFGSPLRQLPGSAQLLKAPRSGGPSSRGLASAELTRTSAFPRPPSPNSTRTHL